MAMLAQSDRPAGIFCSNDGLAIEVLQAALLLGIRVPEDLYVVGFDNVPMAGWPAFRLTTVEYPIEQLVEAILQSLERRHIADDGRENLTQRIKTRLVIRQTTPMGLQLAADADRAGKSS